MTKLKIMVTTRNRLNCMHDQYIWNVWQRRIVKWVNWSKLERSSWGWKENEWDAMLSLGRKIICLLRDEREKWKIVLQQSGVSIDIDSVDDGSRSWQCRYPSLLEIDIGAALVSMQYRAAIFAVQLLSLYGEMCDSM